MSQYYPPDPGGAATRARNLAHALADQGHSVDVVAARPHYPDGPTRNEAPRFYRERKGLNVFRTPILGLSHSGIQRHLVLYGFFVMLATFYGVFRLRSVKVIWCVSPNYLSVLPALLMRLTHGSKVVLEVVDLWPQALVSSGYLREGSLAKAIETMCNLFVRSSDCVTTLTKNMSQIIEHSGVPKGRIHILPNAVDSAVLNARGTAEARPIYYKDRYLVTYSGNIGAIYDFDVLLQAAILLQNEPSVLLVVRGSGERTRDVKDRMNALGVSNMLLLFESASRGDALRHVAWADVCVLPLKSGFDHAASYPIKLLEYLAMGKPVIALADGPIRALISENHAGLALSPGDSKGLAESIIRLKNNPDLARQISSNASKVSVNFSPELFSQGTRAVVNSLAVANDE